MTTNENQPVAPVTPNPDPSPSSAVADDGKASEVKEAASDSAQTTRQKDAGTDSAPYWLCYAMADSDYIKDCDCERGNTWGCSESGDCITEWCVVCAAKAWLRQQQQESSVLVDDSSPAGGVSSPTPSPPEHILQMERDRERLDWIYRNPDALPQIRHKLWCGYQYETERDAHDAAMKMNPSASPVSSVEQK